MRSSRARLGIMASLLGLVAVLGAVWLVRSATTDSGDTAASDATSASGVRSDGGAATSPGGDGDGTADGGTPGSGKSNGGDGGRTSGDGRKQEGGKGGFHVNGVNIDGNGNGDGCVTFDNRTATPVHITGVSITVVSRPKGAGRAAVRSDRAAHCSGGNPACEGLELEEGRQCQVGAVLAKGAAPGDYVIAAVAEFTVRCVDEVNPCDLVARQTGVTPTAKHPVLASSRTAALSTGLTVEGAEPPPDRPSSSPKSPAPPVVSPRPEPDSPSASEEG